MAKPVKSHKRSVPVIRSRNPRVVEENKRFHEVSQEITGLLQRSSRWKNRRAVLAGTIIRICATKGVKIETVKRNLLRRICDADTIANIDNMLVSMNKKTKGLKR